MGGKRRIDDFFTSTTSKKSRLANRWFDRAEDLTLQAKSIAQPTGLSVIRSFITADEEGSLLAYLDSQPWRTDLSRRCMHYGGTYCLMPPKSCTLEEKARVEATIYDAPAIPPEIDVVVDRMIEAGLYTQTSRPRYCIVNEYKPGLGISAHVENFRFGEPVCSLTLAGRDTMRFHQLESAHDGSVRSGKAAKAPRTGRRVDIEMEQRSLLILRDEARSSWQHEIVRGRVASKPAEWRRVSLTFRVDKKDHGGKKV